MAIDPLHPLAREDKWDLANGRGAMYAPAFPRFLDTPGFWDESYLYDLPLERLFTVLIVDERHRPIAFSTRRRVWRPDRLTIEREADGLECREDRVIVGDHIFASRLALANRSEQPLTLALIQWSLQPRAEKLERDGVSIGAPRRDGAALVFPLTVRRAGAEVELHAAIGADIPPTSHTVNPTEWHDTAPLWETSIFQDKLGGGGLPGEDEFAVGTRSEGLAHLGLHYRVEIPPGESWHVSFAFAASTEPGRAERAIGTLPEIDVVASSE